MTKPITNWAGNITFGTRRLHRPSSVAQLRTLVGGSERVRVLGTGHSFNRLADTAGELVSVAGLPGTIEIDESAATVRVAAGVRYGELARRLHAAGYAVPNLASLPHISVAGACATGTHGSGDRLGNLATSVSGLELVTADGELRTVSRRADGDRFAGMVVALGALGVVTSVTLDLVPTFEVRQDVYDDLALERLDGNWAEIFASGYSVSLFTDWTGPRFNQLWIKRRVDGPDTGRPARSWLGARLADTPRHPVPGMSPVHCTDQLGVPGAWHTRLPHFRLDFTPSSGEELQSEYLLPRSRLMEALTALDAIRHRIAPVLQISEVRTIAADDLWLSPSYRRDTVGLHFTWISDARAVLPVLTGIEQRLNPLQARPHWGKLFAAGPEVVRGLYPRHTDFRALMADWDPAGTFRNDFMDRYFPATAEASNH